MKMDVSNDISVDTEYGRNTCNGGCNVREYLRGLMPEIGIIVLLFIISTIVGYAHTAFDPSSSTLSLEGLEELVELIRSLNAFEIMLFIFFNNAIKSLIAFVFGLGFGIIPLLFVVSNGYILGVITYLESMDNGLAYVAIAILPHGVIELPMILISAAMGLRMGLLVFNGLAGKDVDIKKEFLQGLNVFFRFIAPLLLVAAAIETFITPLLIALFTGLI
ncbi:stage II sporulation protein M [Methanococcoides sp.]|uniref:stage II sporulation protein M n=1 Tax=Methanococcoides sp. TaxID=1966350 RepID=UPI00272E6FFA|nr:stage II sporulation protein M [Methanococcoides sp.]